MPRRRNPSSGVTVKAHTSNDQILNLRPVAFEGGKTLNLSVGIGSGAFRNGDPPNVIWTGRRPRPQHRLQRDEGDTGVEG